MQRRGGKAAGGAAGVIPARTPAPSPSTRYRDIYDVVACIPPGHVATYGQVALLAGLPGRARLVGHAMSAVTDRGMPWHRVVNARGEISPRSDGDPGADLQRLRLESEGVIFDRHGRIPLARFQWRPVATGTND